MNSRLIKIFYVICTLALLISLACCNHSAASSPLVISTNTYVIEAGEDIDVQAIIDMLVTDTEPPPDTSADATDIVSGESTETVQENTDTVYWVAGGEVWHTRSNCSSLSRSKNILSGTVEDAVLAGKERVCKRCGS